MIPESNDGNKTWLEKPKLRPIEAIPVVSRGNRFICLRDPERLVMSTILLPQAAAMVISFFNGQNDLRDIQAGIFRHYGELIDTEIIQKLVGDLDEYLFLEGETFDRFLVKEREDFRNLKTRPALFAGLSYAAQAGELEKELLSYHRGSTDPEEPLPPPRGLVAPHIDFPRGGHCYAGAYHKLNPEDPPELVVLLGTAHSTTRHLLAMCAKNFDTPFGPAPLEHDLAELLSEKLGPGITEDEFVHRGEHSVEFQTVWLMEKYRRTTPPRILPFLCGSFHPFIESDTGPQDDPRYEEMLSALKNALAQWSSANGRVMILASADLSHVGPKFGDLVSVTAASAEDVRAYDLALMEKAANGDFQGFYQKTAGNLDRTNICGLSSIYTLLRLLDGPRGRLLEYDQWRDDAGQEMVTFASLIYPY